MRLFDLHQLLEKLKALIEAFTVVKTVWEYGIATVTNYPSVILVLLLVLGCALLLVLFTYLRKRQLASKNFKAFAYVRSIAMIADNSRNEVDIDCNVTFLGLADEVKTSPSELALIVKGGNVDKDVICTLKSPSGAKLIKRYGWEWMPYRGCITSNEGPRLIRAIEKAMMCQPDCGPVYAAVEIDLAPGETLEAHLNSRVQFNPPALVAGRPSFIVHIANWTDGIPAKWRGTPLP